MRLILLLLLIAVGIGLLFHLLRRGRAAEGAGHTTLGEGPPTRPGLSPSQEIQGAPPDIAEPASHDPTAEARRAMSGPRPSVDTDARRPATAETERSADTTEEEGRDVQDDLLGRH